MRSPQLREPKQSYEWRQHLSPLFIPGAGVADSRYTNAARTSEIVRWYA